jgi:GNAT superfamily N-acetyltransferase
MPDLSGVTFVDVDPGGADAVRSMSRYFEELDHRFTTGFDAGDALEAGATAFAPPTGVFVIAHAAPPGSGGPVACGGLQRVDESTAEIKRMWVDPQWRGVGLGKRMLSELEDHARRIGYRRVILDTNAVLTEAITMYRRAGYTDIERYNDNPYAMHWFAKPLEPSLPGRVQRPD